MSEKFENSNTKKLEIDTNNLEIDAKNKNILAENQAIEINPNMIEIAPIIKFASQKDEKKALKIKKKQEKKELREKRKGTFLYRFIAKVGKFLIKFMWPTKIYFKERAIKDSRALYISNHYGYMDSNPIIGRIFGEKTNVVFKSELSRYKLFAGCMKEVGGIPVKRGENDLAAIKQILRVLNNDEQLLIYPEGARNPNEIKEMLPFKDGAATFALKTHSPIVPMMQYTKSKFYKINYLMVGEPFDLSQFYDKKLHEVKQLATDYIYEKMLELRKEIDILVEVCHGNKKKYLKYKARLDV